MWWGGVPVLDDNARPGADREAAVPGHRVRGALEHECEPGLRSQGSYSGHPQPRAAARTGGADQRRGEGGQVQGPPRTRRLHTTPRRRGRQQQ